MKEGKIKIVFVGGGFSNKGSEAMIISAYSTLKRTISPNTKFTVASYSKEDLKRNKDYEFEIIENPALTKKPIFFLFAILYRLLPFKTIRHLIVKRNFLLKNLTEADLIIDLSGFGLSDQISIVRSLRYCFEIMTAKILGVPFVVYPQSMGPFNNRLIQILAKVFLPLVDLIIVRGDTTKKYLEQIGVNKKKKIHVCADLAFLFDPSPKKRALEILRINNIPNDETNLIGIVPNMRIYERCKNLGVKNEYVKMLSCIIDYISDEWGARIVLIPHEFQPDGYDDRLLIEYILNNIQNKENVFVIDQEYSSAELKAILGQLNLLIASRFHSVVASLSMHVPVLVIGWAHKYGELMKMMGQEKYVLDYQNVSTDEIKVKLNEMWLKKEEIRDGLEFNVKKSKKSANRAALLVHSLLKSKRSLIGMGMIE